MIIIVLKRSRVNLCHEDKIHIFFPNELLFLIHQTMALLNCACTIRLKKQLRALARDRYFHLALYTIEKNQKAIDQVLRGKLYDAVVILYCMNHE